MLHRENQIKQYHTSSAADLLKEVMDYYDITQADLAERIGVSKKIFLIFLTVNVT